MQAKRKVGIDLNQPARFGHIGNITLGGVNQLKYPQALIVESLAFGRELEASGGAMK
ncbi:hypothetical protein D3C75_781240 [compost metagenome]